MSMAIGSSPNKDPNDECTGWFEILDDEDHHRYARPLNKGRRTRHAIRLFRIRI